MSKTTTCARIQNREKRNQRIREAFRQRFTDAPRPRKLSREYVLAQLADEFFLSVATIEDIVYQP
jgi:predicted nuclease of restriction endonuclease-like RecB superfamily